MKKLWMSTRISVKVLHALRAKKSDKTKMKAKIVKYETKKRIIFVKRVCKCF